MGLAEKHAILDALMTVLDEEHAQAVYEHRRVTKKTPLTVFGAKRLAGKLAQWHDANEAACIMIDRCWQGFEVDWAMKHIRPPLRPQGIIGAAFDLMENGYGQGNAGDQRALEFAPAISRH